MEVVCVCAQPSAFSDEEERFILNNARPLTPLVLDPINHTSCWDGLAPSYEPKPNVEMDPPPRLPTPEERMRQQAEAVAADIVPINITGSYHWCKLVKIILKPILALNLKWNMGLDSRLAIIWTHSIGNSTWTRVTSKCGFTWKHDSDFKLNHNAGLSSE